MEGQQFEKLANALTDAFNAQRLGMMLQFRLNRRLDTLVTPGPVPAMVFELIQVAEAEGWTLDLVVAAREYVPRNQRLLEAAQEFELASTSPSHPFERIIKDTSPFIDPAVWARRMAEVETQVCRVEVPVKHGMSYGTGFLVGPDVVLTNYHVVKPLLDQRSNPKEVVFRFDYKVTRGGMRVNPGLEFRLAEDWHIDSSPYDVADTQAHPAGQPDPNHLDYALVRLSSQAGLEPVGKKKAPGEPASPRRWMVLPANEFTWTKQMPLLIMQHPKGDPLKLAFEADAQVIPNGNLTRVRYSVNTEGGSSGSPCFTKDWDLVALHHAGDPDETRLAQYNQGIPLSRIVARMQASGAYAAVAAAPPAAENED